MTKPAHGQVWSVDDWQRKPNRSGSLAEFFATSPLRDSDVDVHRVEIPNRDTPL